MLTMTYNPHIHNPHFKSKNLTPLVFVTIKFNFLFKLYYQEACGILEHASIFVVK